MAVNNIESTNILVFPSTLRSKDPAASYTTEYNLTALLNRLLDRRGFVITNATSIDNNVLSNFEFNIMGYIFNLTTIDLTKIEGYRTTEYKYLNASINIKYDSYSGLDKFKNWQQLSGIDTLDQTNPQYTGLTLEWSDVECNDDNEHTVQAGVIDGTDYRLTLLERTINGVNTYAFNIPQKSKVKFETSTNGSNRSVTIDDGVLG